MRHKQVASIKQPVGMKMRAGDVSDNMDKRQAESTDWEFKGSRALQWTVIL
jgi:hypothetical protein